MLPITLLTILLCIGGMIEMVILIWSGMYDLLVIGYTSFVFLEQEKANLMLVKISVMI